MFKIRFAPKRARIIIAYSVVAVIFALFVYTVWNGVITNNMILVMMGTGIMASGLCPFIKLKVRKGSFRDGVKILLMSVCMLGGVGFVSYSITKQMQLNIWLGTILTIVILLFEVGAINFTKKHHLKII